MNYLFSNRLIRPLPPVALLGACLWAMFALNRFSPAWQSMLTEALPLAAVCVAMLLSIRFNRSRYSFLLLFLVFAWLTQTQLRGQLLPATESLLFTTLIANSFAFSFLKDRSLFSVHGLLRIGALTLQAGAIWYLVTRVPAVPLALQQHEWFTLPETIAIFVQLPDGVVAATLLVNLAHLILSLVRNSSTQATFFGCQLGLLGIASGYPHDAFVPFLVTSCGLMVALAIILDSHDMAYRDELTALPSRRALNQALLSLGRRYTIAMLDIDHFKKFNDTHGHDIGDEVLRMVASRIARVGGGGKAYRYGGEEFTVVFPGKTPAQAEAHLQALCESIESYRMVVRGRQRQRGNDAGKRARVRRGKNDPRYQSLSVTISIGYAARDPDRRLPDAVVKAADQALYRAKKKGRNRISC